MIKVTALHKSYLGGANGKIPTHVLNGIDLSLDEGEFVTLFGPNGCGKTTLLKVLAGIEPYDSGSVTIGSKKPSEARTGFVFQNYDDSLMPWLNCRENILFAYRLKKRKRQREEATTRLHQLLKDLNLDLPLNLYPYQLSGGQKQLTAILRTLIYKPDILLLDEPFSSLDHQTRAYMQTTLLDIWHHEGSTILFVSHDIEEAIFLADRVLLLEHLPTRIRQETIIPFSRPRKRTLFNDDEFFRLRVQCLKIMDFETL